ncbi:hypothetical protein Slin15195_G059450 [Septoria linicola]|uniref:Uncharacterized protein n=1 Tax=Septoria linicola TaxID=215465 RepID=A0A9Q9AVI8_9PEZI|nr:hypothetical protein Slin14017_G075310 [Septoria linicola]USW52626.1 hypothetical protein Slin15195_G059450 [Septoria linicola]
MFSVALPKFRALGPVTPSLDMLLAPRPVQNQTSYGSPKDTTIEALTSSDEASDLEIFDTHRVGTWDTAIDVP